MSTYAAAPTTTANNTNQKAAQSRSVLVNGMPFPVIVALSTTDNNTNQKAAQSTSTILNLLARSVVVAQSTTDNNTNQNSVQLLLSKAVLIVPLGRPVDAAPQPTAINTGGGQAGYAG